MITNVTISLDISFYVNIISLGIYIIIVIINTLIKIYTFIFFKL